MYSLYHSTGACSLATLTILNELAIPVKVINVNTLTDFDTVNPVASVPALTIDDQVLTEGAAIVLYLLKKHDNDLLPSEPQARQQAIEHIMFANATMHPAYSKLFFINEHISNEDAKQQALDAAAAHINKLWQVVEDKLSQQQYLGGDQPSAADIMLAVYSSWGVYFPVAINFGERTTNMLLETRSRSSFRTALASDEA
ncbi:MAG: glutathione S-transferase [Gammaproteobacteria bacterium MedPE]|nr:MAG: glutathione S-transferase [Gammaproteobacteria bacterium MedPE]